MAIKIFDDIEQGSEEWFAVRLGIPTASRFPTVLAKGKDEGASITRTKYMHDLAGEILTREPAETYSNHHMERGKAFEAEARDYYCYRRDVEPRRVGFVLDEAKRCGASPDSLIGEDRVLEVKCAIPSVLIPLVLKGEFPPAHKAQCQGALWVCKREVVDIIVYCKGMTPLIKEAPRDEKYIANLASEVARFNDELLALVEKLKRQG